MESSRIALKAAGIVFLVVGIAHALRVLFRVPIILGTLSIPHSVSVIAFFVAMALTAWMFYSAK